MSTQDSIVPLEPNDIARRYGAKPGYQLIDFLQVALPVFVIPIEAIVIAAKPLGLVDEFLLRSINENINTLRPFRVSSAWMKCSSRSVLAN
jgi:hypothetical protein